MELTTQSFLSIDQLASQVLNPHRTESENNTTRDGLTFGQVLSTKTLESEGLRFSRHASLRMNDRGMEMTGEQMERLQSGAERAAQKGIKDSLVLVDNMAFIVNVPNRTVITAMDAQETNENVFTNINGAVIM